MIVTTTPSVEGRNIVDYKGVVVGEAILGANVFRDIFASITDIVGGRSGAYEASLAEARATALRELEERGLVADFVSCLESGTQVGRFIIEESLGRGGEGKGKGGDAPARPRCGLRGTRGGATG